MAAVETVREATLRMGSGGYIEVARKRSAEGGEASEFVMLARGFVDGEGRKRWTRFVTLPADEDSLSWVAEALRHAARSD